MLLLLLLHMELKVAVDEAELAEGGGDSINSVVDGEDTDEEPSRLGLDMLGEVDAGCTDNIR